MKNDLKMCSWFDEHWYPVFTPQGTKWLVSATTILQASPKPYLITWRGNMGNEEADKVMNEARTRGKIVHAAAELLAKGGVIVYNSFINSQYSEQDIHNLRKYREVMVIEDQDIFLHIYRIHKFFEAVNPTYVETEETVYSLQHEYAGTRDLLLYIKEGSYNINGSKPLDLEAGYYICDYKTGKSVGDEAFMQMAAYRQAEKECRPMIGEKIKGALVLHTQSTNKKGIEGFAAKLRTAKELDRDFENFLKVYEVWKIAPTTTAPRFIEMEALLQWSPKTEETKDIQPAAEPATVQAGKIETSSFQEVI